MTARLALAVIVSAAVTLVAGVVAAPAVEAQLARDTRFAGLQWTFVRIKYTANTQPGRYRMEDRASRGPSTVPRRNRTCRGESRA